MSDLIINYDFFNYRALWLSMRKEPLGANASPPDESPLSESASANNYVPSPMMGENESFTVYHRDNNLAQRGIPEENGLDDTSTMMEQQEQGGNEGEEMELTLLYEPGPLGIHVVPEHRGNVKNQGLIVQNVEPGGRIHRDGRLQAGDKIVEINSESLVGVPFQKAQEHFREGLNKPQLRLRVVKYRRRNSGEKGANNVVEEYRHPSVSVQNLVQKFSSSELPLGGAVASGGEQAKTPSEEKENMIQGQERSELISAWEISLLFGFPMHAGCANCSRVL